MLAQHGRKQKKEKKLWQMKKSKAVMLINASGVARSYRRKGAKELSFLGEDCYTLQQQSTSMLCKMSN